MLFFTHDKFTEKKSFSERFEATEALINSTFARQTTSKSLPANVISYIQLHKNYCTTVIFSAICTGSFRPVSTHQDGKLCEIRATRIKTLNLYTIPFKSYIDY